MAIVKVHFFPSWFSKESLWGGHRNCNVHHYKPWQQVTLLLFCQKKKVWKLKADDWITFSSLSSFWENVQRFSLFCLLTFDILCIIKQLLTCILERLCILQPFDCCCYPWLGNSVLGATKYTVPFVAVKRSQYIIGKWHFRSLVGAVYIGGSDASCTWVHNSCLSWDYHNLDRQLPNVTVWQSFL